MPRPRTSNSIRCVLLAGLSTIPLLAGCWTPSRSEVVVYTALDSEFSKPIFADFTTATGIEVLPKFDTEASKSVGLANALLAEADRPRADVFWNNEILNTLRLEAAGMLTAYVPPLAKEYPEAFRSPAGLWHGFAARARVLLVNTELVPAAERPTSIEDLTSGKWKGAIGIAKPLFGTTATHAAALFAVQGDEAAKGFFRRLKANNVQILPGNKQVALAVSSGQLKLGLTDTDDAIIEVQAGRPVAIIYPDRAADQMGTLFIPNTLAIIRDCPHRAAAERLVDYLLTPAIESKLAAGPSAQIPLHPQATAPAQIATPQTVKALPVDFRQAAEKWEPAMTFLTDEFLAE